MRFLSFKFKILSRLLTIVLCVLFYTNVFAEVKENMNRKDLPEAYYKNPLEFMEAEFEKTKDWQRALEISLYYMGYPEEDIFFRFNWQKLADDFNDIPNDFEMRFNPIIRDEKLAYKWAKISAEEYRKENFYASGSPYYYFAYLNIEGIGTKRDIDKFNDAYNYFIFLSKEPPYENSQFGGIFTYTFFYGNDEIKKDPELSEEIIKTQLFSKYIWKNFYCGFMLPKDKAFAIYVLECSVKRNASIDTYRYAYFLSEIYKGVYDEADKNDDKLKGAEALKIKIIEDYFKECEEKLSKEIAELERREKSNKPSSMAYPLIMIMKIVAPQEIIVLKKDRDGKDFSIPNKLYDFEKLKQYLQLYIKYETLLKPSNYKNDTSYSYLKRKGYDEETIKNKIDSYYKFDDMQIFNFLKRRNASDETIEKILESKNKAWQ